MKKKILYILSVILLLMFIIFSMINQQNNEFSRTFFYMGTVIDITVYDVKDDSILDEVSDVILKYDNMFSRHIKSSEISKLNETGELEVSAETKYLIEAAIKYSQLSNGYFDITINPIVELWSIGETTAKVPTEEDIILALDHVGYDKITIEDHTVTLNNTTIDLGGIAKGFIADEIADLLRENNIEKALINLGGNVYALGSSSSNQDWNIGIRTPSFNEPGVLLKLMLQDKSVVTSGVYERYLEVDSKIYHHIFDPFTGYPMDNDLLSLTVVSDQSIDGDALSTALFNLGLEEAFILSNQLGVEIIVVTRDNEVYVQSSLESKLELLDTTYKLKIKE